MLLSNHVDKPASKVLPRVSRRSSERGSTIVEFAFIFVVTLILMFGIIDFARAVYSYHLLTFAAREGARFASVRGQECTSLPAPSCPADQPHITDFVKSIVQQSGIDQSAITVTYPVPDNPNNLPVCGTYWNYPGCAVDVQVTYDFNYIFPISFYGAAPVSFQAGTIHMGSTAEMTISR